MNARDLIEALKETENKPKPYDTTAEVVRIEDGTAWVHIPGGEDETPVSMSVNASPGETVRVRVAGGQAWITGNDSAPPTDDTTAIRAEATAVVARDYAETALQDAEIAHEAALDAQASAAVASEAAGEAKASATNANEYASRALGGLSTVQSVAETLTWITQHGTMTNTQALTPPETALDPTHVYFVVDANGDYTVGSTHYSIVTEPDVNDIASYYVLSIDESLNNYVGTHLTLTNDGLWLLPAGTGSYKVLIATGATGSAYTAGTYIIDNTGGTVAYFGSQGLEVFHGLTEIAHLGYGSGNNDQGGTSTAPYYTIGKRVANSSVGNYSVAIGEEVVASGFASIAEGTGTEASGYGSHAEGYGYFGAGLQNNNYIKATNIGAHAEGSAAYGDIIASGIGAHAEGRGPIVASGIGAHAEGDGTEACSYAAHAEGTDTVARGYASHAQNSHTIAESSDQTAMGSWNVADPNGEYALIIGNGTADNARSNAFTIDWDGNITFGDQNTWEKLGSGDQIVRNKAWSYSDCDSATETGWYFISAAQVSGGISNFPPTSDSVYFLVLSYSDNFKTQFAFSREQNSQAIYWRNKVTAGWGAWKMVGEMNTTPSFTAPTMSTARATLASGGYYKAGKLVYVQMAMTIASARNANTMWSYASGFPTPAGTRVALTAYVNGKGTPYTACIDNGTLNLINGNTGTAVNDVVYITGQYIEASS